MLEGKSDAFSQEKEIKEHLFDEAPRLNQMNFQKHTQGKNRSSNPNA
jgi:hypothetical protein